jgi:peptidoglycan glycosyltransferase
VYERQYPEGTFAAHTVGYYAIRYGRAGVEAAANDVLAGRRVFRDWNDVIAAATGQPVRGNDVVLTIDADVQRAAEKALGKSKGAVLAIDPRTGAVLASASTPDYDPNTVQAQWDDLSSDADAPLLDRSRQSLRAPGSTFKIVTLTGALADGTATLKSTYPGPARLEIGGAPVTNYGGSGYGATDLRSATMRSINTVFAQLAVEMGPEQLVQQSERFGFNRDPGYELPARQSLMPDPAEMTTWETAWAGVGQPVGEHESPPGPQATVMQMALVAAGIANDGIVMQPHVISEVTDETGDTVLRTRQRRLSVAVDAETAERVTSAMVDTVRAGSGTRAQVAGVSVAGKTGTAEIGRDRPTDAWFIAFAPAEDPVVAIALLIEEGGVGGQVAAPLVKPVLEVALKAQGFTSR